MSKSRTKPEKHTSPDVIKERLKANNLTSGDAQEAIRNVERMERERIITKDEARKLKIQLEGVE